MSGKRRFDVPIQVAFWDVDGDKYIGGIALDNQIICGCCGSIIDIDEVYEFAPEGIVPIREYDWIDISDDIIGGVDPLVDED